MRKNVFAVFKVKVTVTAHNQNMPHSAISADLPVLLRTDLVRWYIITSWGVLWKDWIAVLKVKVTEKVQNFIQCLSILYFLCKWSFLNQTRCVDVNCY